MSDPQTIDIQSWPLRLKAFKHINAKIGIHNPVYIATEHQALQIIDEVGGGLTKDGFSTTDSLTAKLCGQIGIYDGIRIIVDMRCPKRKHTTQNNFKQRSEVMPTAQKPASGRTGDTRRSEQGTCGGTPRRDGSGGGKGNRGTPHQPKKR